MGWFNLRNIALFLFIITTLLDVLSTIIVKFKHPIFNESNPLVVFGISIWGLLAFILIVKGFLLWFYLKRYYKLPKIAVRYVMVYFLVLMVLMQLGAVVGNFRVINTPSEDIIEGTAQQKLKAYSEAVGELKILENITPTLGARESNIKIPFIIVFFFINLLQFLVWQSFETHSWKVNNERIPDNFGNIDGLRIL